MPVTLLGIAKLTNGEIEAIDGKALRGSRDGEKSAIYMVNAWAKASGIVVGQMKVNEKTNEIKAIPELLKNLAVKGTETLGYREYALVFGYDLQ